jgi:alkyl hydroperoxide reductase subunit F
LLIDEKTKEELLTLLSSLTFPVKLVFFTQKNAYPVCVEQQNLLEELVSLSEKLNLEVYDFVMHGDETRNYEINKIPATAVIGKKDYGNRFYGLTAGYEFTSLLESIIMVSNEQSGLSPEIETLVRRISEPVHIQVMVTLTCPYCPRMVHVANQFAIANNNIRADMVEASQFPQLVQRYDVTGVPKTIINEVYSFEGAIPAEAAYVEILKAVDPEGYKRLEEAIQEFQGVRKAIKAEPERLYDVLIVGGGPAGMSSAIYAARKGLEVVLISKKLGGQINYTAKIDNYLGLSEVSGVDMAEAFRKHMEKYPVAEDLGASVVKVIKKDERFLVTTEDGRRFIGRSLIYCAGKEFSRLGVPGEEQFIGRGIGFCATCDAPLYRGKRVAVVGGGNSAFTAVRDLENYASEIHLIHRRDEFSADEALIQEAEASRKVTFHKLTIVKSFLGKEKLTGVRLESVGDGNRFDLLVDGVFLEVGLTPNSAPLRGFIELNEFGEIPIKPDNSTKVKGFFAAGDVTDVGEKQISIAVGHGALAALSAYKYLFENKLITNKKRLTDVWQ